MIGDRRSTRWPMLLGIVVSLLAAGSAGIESAAAQTRKPTAKKGQAPRKAGAKRKQSGKSKPAAKSSKKKKTPPKPKLPDLKSPKDKLLFLELIRRSMPTLRRGTTVRFSPLDLDKALEHRIGLSRREYAPIISDEAFVRRASLDLIGKVPPGVVVKRFVADTDRIKRAKLVDELLETNDYARKWARYWKTVIFYNATANKNRVNPQALEDWLTEQIAKNVRWDRITAELVSATPVRNKKKKNDFGQNHGPNNFVLAYNSKAPEIASQTARIFMGISIQCAECHDHPFDQWKREQFHELAAFFSRGKYYMPDRTDPSKKTLMQAKFLLGEQPPDYLKPDQRRVAVAAYLIYNPDNYWFARAYVNRIWNELIGDGFYAVDSLGPDGEVVHRLVVNRLASVFRYKDFDMKWLFRLIMNSRTYQRDIRSIESESKLFTAVRPTRLRPSEVLASVEKLTGENKPLGRAINATFKVDPSIPQKDLEGSIQQALLMMNNGTLQARLKNGPLKKRIMQIKADRPMIRELYLEILARTPTDRETARSLSYLKRVNNRNEAVDDLIWVLVNSTEFVTKR